MTPAHQTNSIGSQPQGQNSKIHHWVQRDKQTVQKTESIMIPVHVQNSESQTNAINLIKIFLRLTTHTYHLTNHFIATSPQH
jgi:hypothetical protein